MRNNIAVEVRLPYSPGDRVEFGPEASPQTGSVVGVKLAVGDYAASTRIVVHVDRSYGGTTDDEMDPVVLRPAVGCRPCLYTMRYELQPCEPPPEDQSPVNKMPV